MQVIVTGPALNSGIQLRPLISDFIKLRFGNNAIQLVAGESGLDGVLPAADVGDPPNAAAQSQQANESARLIEFFVDAEFAIARAIAAGGSVQQTVRSWVLYTERWLAATVEGAVDRMIMDAALLFEKSSLVESEIERFTGLSPLGRRHRSDSRLHDNDPFIRMVAKSIVSNSEAIRATQQKLDLFKSRPQNILVSEAQDIDGRLATEEAVLSQTMAGAAAFPIIIRGPKPMPDTRPELEAELEKLRAGYEQLEDRLTESELRAAQQDIAHQTEIDELSVSLHDSFQRVREAEAEQAAAQAAIEQRDALIEALRDQLAERDREIDQLREHGDMLEASLAARQAKFENAEAALHEARESAARHEADVQKFKLEASDLERELVSLSETLNDNEAALDQLYESYVESRDNSNGAIEETDRLLHLRTERYRREITILKELTLLSRERVSYAWSRPVRAVEGVAEKFLKMDARKHHKLISRSGYFDANWYTRAYPDVAASGMAPLTHFLNHGLAERRDPGPHFSTLRYMQDNPDVAQSGAQPFLHYLTAGIMEGRIATDSAIKLNG